MLLYCSLSVKFESFEPFFFICIDQKKKNRSRQKKLKAYDLSTLSEFLPEVNASQKSAQPAPDLKMNCKRRQELVYVSTFSSMV